jgi:hypothetical protein
VGQVGFSVVIKRAQIWMTVDVCMMIHLNTSIAAVCTFTVVLMTPMRVVKNRWRFRIWTDYL